MYCSYPKAILRYGTLVSEWQTSRHTRMLTYRHFKSPFDITGMFMVCERRPELLHESTSDIKTPSRDVSLNKCWTRIADSPDHCSIRKLEMKLYRITRPGPTNLQLKQSTHEDFLNLKIFFVCSRLRTSRTISHWTSLDYLVLIWCQNALEHRKWHLHSSRGCWSWLQTYSNSLLVYSKTI